jgi:hypothetical protein
VGRARANRVCVADHPRSLFWKGTTAESTWGRKKRTNKKPPEDVWNRPLSDPESLGYREYCSTPRRYPSPPTERELPLRGHTGHSKSRTPRRPQKRKQSPSHPGWLRAPYFQFSAIRPRSHNKRATTKEEGKTFRRPGPQPALKF